MTTHTPESCPMNARMLKVERKQQRTERLGEVLFDTDMVGVRVLLAMSEFIWALALLWHGDTFGRPTYTIMALICVEEVWGGIFFLTGWVQWQLILIGDFKCLTARVFAMWNSVLWVFVTVSMYMSVYPPPAAISGDTALAIAATWILIRPWILKGSRA